MSRNIWAIIFIVTLFSGCQSNTAPELVTAGDNTANTPARATRAAAPLSESQLRRQIEFARKEKDQDLRTAQDSPMPVAERTEFKGLNYFPVDFSYRVESALNRYQNAEQVKMATSHGEPDTYIRYGAVKFKLAGVDCSLDAFKAVDDDSHRLFIPFRDQTSGKESYGAGRYIEIEEDGGVKYTLDFNLAYNPYCAYNPSYSCPIPPLQNTLKIAIQAGEKAYHN